MTIFETGADLSWPIVRDEAGKLREELLKAERMVWLLVSAAGCSIRIPPDLLMEYDPSKSRLEIKIDFETQSIVCRSGFERKLAPLVYRGDATK